MDNVYTGLGELIRCDALEVETPFLVPRTMP